MAPQRRTWLIEQIASWEADGIITAQQAATLRARYPQPPPAPSAAPAILGGIGAIVIGLGVILLLAWNWSGLGRHAKLGIVLAGVAALHLAGILYGGRGRRTAAEILHLLGSMGFGAGIWLIGQAYHLSAHWPDGFLAWIAGTLAMAFALGSAWHAVLAAAVMVVWSWSEWLAFSHAPPAAPAMALVLLGGLADRLRGASSGAAATSALAAAVAATAALIAVGIDGGTIAVQMPALAVLAGALGEAGCRWSGAARPMAVLLTLPTLALLGFSDLAREAVGRHDVGAAAGTYTAVSVLAALVAVAWTVRAAAMGRVGRSDAAARVLLPALCMVMAGMAMLAERDDAGGAAVTALAATCSLALIAILVLGLLAAVERGRAGAALGWALPLAGWLFLRFCWWFDNLAARGAAFLLIGLGLILIGGVAARRAARARTGSP